MLMISNEEIKELKSILSEHPKEVQELMLLSGFMSLKAMDAISDKDSTKEKLLQEISEDIGNLALADLLILKSIVNVMKVKREFKQMTNVNVENMKKAAFEEGFNKGKELRIKELKKMREL